MPTIKKTQEKRREEPHNPPPPPQKDQAKPPPPLLPQRRRTRCHSRWYGRQADTYCSVLAGVHHDRPFSSGMVVQKSSDIVHFVRDNHPTIFVGIVLGYLTACERRHHQLQCVNVGLKIFDFFKTFLTATPRFYPGPGRIDWTRNQHRHSVQFNPPTPLHPHCPAP